MRERALRVNSCPARTRSAPSTQTFAGPRRYARGAVIRWPARDQPATGGNVRGVIGPSASTHRTGAPSGGFRERVTTAVLWGRRPGRCWSPTSACSASARLRRARSVGPGDARSACSMRVRPRPARRGSRAPHPLDLRPPACQQTDAGAVRALAAPPTRCYDVYPFGSAEVCVPNLVDHPGQHHPRRCSAQSAHGRFGGDSRVRPHWPWDASHPNST